MKFLKYMNVGMLWKKRFSYLFIWIDSKPNVWDSSSSIDIARCAYLGGSDCSRGKQNGFGYRFYSIGMLSTTTNDPA